MTGRDGTPVYAKTPVGVLIYMPTAMRDAVKHLIIDAKIRGGASEYVRDLIAADLDRRNQEAARHA